MDKVGFDDIEMKNRNSIAEGIKEEGETSFGRDDLEDPSASINIINTENSVNAENRKIKFNRVGRKQSESVLDIKKDIGSMRRSMTSDRKKFFQKIFDVNIEKKTDQIQAYC